MVDESSDSSLLLGVDYVGGWYVRGSDVFETIGIFLVCSYSLPHLAAILSDKFHFFQSVCCKNTPSYNVVDPSDHHLREKTREYLFFIIAAKPKLLASQCSFSVQFLDFLDN